jgi:hypothetical protein
MAIEYAIAISPSSRNAQKRTPEMPPGFQRQGE